MVEIKIVEAPNLVPNQDTCEDDEKYRLVYSKSKVYVNPTAYARDNISGFVALVKKVVCFVCALTSLLILHTPDRKPSILSIFLLGYQNLY
jgi:hypothetical protein